MSAQLMPEFSTYLHLLPKLLDQHEGEYVVIKDTEAVRFAPTYEAALTWGYDMYGLAPFFVKRVAVDAATVHMTRDFGPCPKQN
jgi:hypothetical protein